jgi:hypothetical protein
MDGEPGVGCPIVNGDFSPGFEARGPVFNRWSTTRNQASGWYFGFRFLFRLSTFRTSTSIGFALLYIRVCVFPFYWAIGFFKPIEMHIFFSLLTSNDII